MENDRGSYIPLRMPMIAAWYGLYRFSVRSFWDSSLDYLIFTLRTPWAHADVTVDGGYYTYTTAKTRLLQLDNAAWSLNAVYHGRNG
jgi:hypothetical protein